MRLVFSIILFGMTALYGQTTHTVKRIQQPPQPALTQEQGQTQSTVEATLGKEKVQGIVSKVLAVSKAQVEQTYVITDDELKLYERAGVSGQGVSNLKTIKDREIRGQRVFESTVRDKIGREDARTHKSLILLSAQMTLVIENEFLLRVINIILKTRAPAKANREQWLEKGFERFLSDYILFIKKRTGEGEELVLGIKHWDDFLKAQQVRCGEIPCSVPPCCGDVCDPCKDK